LSSEKQKKAKNTANEGVELFFQDAQKIEKNIDPIVFDQGVVQKIFP
jgi:hypothetical protein